MDSQSYELSEAFPVRCMSGASVIFPPGTATVRPCPGGYTIGLGNHEPVDVAAPELERILAAVQAISAQ